MSAPPAKASAFPSWTLDKPCMSMEWNSLVDVDLVVSSAGGGVDEEDADLVLLGIMAPPAKDESEEEDEEEEEEETSVAPDLSSSALVQAVDEKLVGALTLLLLENGKSFKNGAKLASTTPTLRVHSINNKSRRYIVLGLGTAPKQEEADEKRDDPFAGAGHALGKAVAEKCNDEKKVATVKVVLPSVLCSNDAFVSDFSAAFYQALYSDNRYRTGKTVKKMAQDLKTVTIVSEGGKGEVSTTTAFAIDNGRKLANGLLLAKDIVNSPHNVLNSLSLADTARRIAADSVGGCITCTILDQSECEKRGMGSYLGVARGSETPPQFIHLTYKPPATTTSETTTPLVKVGIVGKGLLFDTGGYNVKSSMMELMKFDCGGAAAVLGAARAIGELQPPGVEAHFVVAACENMINDKAIVPSDILIASNGKTIEVMNTDAEGRLTLADALVFCDKEVGCEKIIELSTLTGSCIIALGQQVAGVWTHNDELADELKDISKVTGDKSWRMPMETAYNEQLESKFADLQNIGGRYGGSITAALFLQNFVRRKKPFAHIDIAGPAWDWKAGTATGYGAKLVTEWVRRQGSSKNEG